jgi:hypothetical protein
VSGTGTVTFTGGASGTDAVLLTPVSCVSNTVTLTSLVPAGLSCALSVTPPRAGLGSRLTVVLTVTNTGGVACTSVTPSLPSPGSMVTGLSGPVPGSVASLAANAVAHFSWTCTSVGTGVAGFNASVSGNDALSAAAAGCSSSASATLVVAANLSCVITAPSTVKQHGTFEVRLAVCNTGGAQADFVSPALSITAGSSGVAPVSGPVPSGFVSLAPLSCQTYTWTYSATGTAPVTFAGGAGASDAGLGGPVSGIAAPASVAILTPGQVTCNVTCQPSPVTEGNDISLVVTISNPGSVTVNGVLPVASVTQGSALVALSGAAPSTPVSIPALGSHSWTLAFKAKKEGTVTFTVTASGTDTDGYASATSCGATESIQLPALPKQEPVKIVGGIRGYIDPKRGEQANILIRPSGSGEIVLRIYDMSGKLIREIRQSCAGGHTETVKWDATDANGATVAPGGYPIHLTAPGIDYRDKLAVLR